MKTQLEKLNNQRGKSIFLILSTLLFSDKLRGSWCAGQWSALWRRLYYRPECYFPVPTRIQDGGRWITCEDVYP